MKDTENRAFKNIKNNVRYDEEDNASVPKNYNKNTLLDPINPAKKLQMLKETGAQSIVAINKKEQKKIF